MSSENIDLLVCPQCKSSLTEIGGKLCCKNDGVEFEINEGYYDFLGKIDPYWGEIPPEEMKHTLELAQSIGWRGAIDELNLSYPNIGEYVKNNLRIDWLFHCINFANTQRCLDIGSGLGAITFGLSKFFSEVWSLETVKERLEFQMIRREQEKINNIRFIRSSWLDLPFPQGSFDLVACNGVLEWIGISDLSQNPEIAQINFLRNIKRILKPNGCLYIGIENRFGLQNFRGARDHSGLPFTSIMPRRFADMAVKAFRRQQDAFDPSLRVAENWNDYRTYTYSYRGYKNLLADTGFEKVDMYWTPDYNLPKISGSLGSESYPFWVKSNECNDSLLKNLISALPSNLIKKIGCITSPAFLIFAYNGTKEERFESKIIEACSPCSGFLRLSGGHRENPKMTYLLLNGDKIKCVAKFNKFGGRKSLFSEEDRLNQYCNTEIWEKTLDSVPVLFEAPIEGRRISLYNLQHNLKVLNWLLDFQSKTQSGFLDFPALESKFKPLNKFLSSLNLNEDTKSAIRSKIDSLLSDLRDYEVPQTAEHGDFYIGNIIIGKDGKVYVIDWEFYQEKGDALFDFIFFILSNCASGSSVKTSLKDNLADNGKYSDILFSLLSKFSNAKNLPEDLVLQSIPYVILRCIQNTLNGSDHRMVNRYLSLLEQSADIDFASIA